MNKVSESTRPLLLTGKRIKEVTGVKKKQTKKQKKKQKGFFIFFHIVTKAVNF